MKRASQSDEAGRLTTSVPTRCTTEQVAGARLAVADYSLRTGLNAFDLVELLEMLGVGSEVQA